MSKPFTHMLSDIRFDLLAFQVELGLRKDIHTRSKVEHVQNCMIDAKHTGPFEDSVQNDTTKQRDKRPRVRSKSKASSNKCPKKVGELWVSDETTSTVLLRADSAKAGAMRAFARLA